jgi:hypothetical protein
MPFTSTKRNRGAVYFWCNNCDRRTRWAQEWDGVRCYDCGDDFTCDECGFEIDRHGDCQRQLVIGDEGKCPSRRIEKAWDLIGEEGQFRLIGGRSTYEAVMYNDATAKSNKVRLAKLVADPHRYGIRQVNRYVDPDTLVEVLAS